MTHWKIKNKIAITYDRWDIENYTHSVVSKISNIMSSDVGKYLKLNDGSKQYVKIISVYLDKVNTSSGLYYTWEILCCLNPRLPNTEYYGCKYDEANLLLVPPTDKEIELSKAVCRKEKIEGKISKRVRSMANELVMQRMLLQGKDQNSIIDETIRLAFEKGQHQFNCLKALGSAVDLDIFEPKKEQPKELPLHSMLDEILNNNMIEEAVIVD